MNKRHLHHTWTLIRKVHYWYFLILAVVFGLIAVFALRNNNLTAGRLRDEVLKVDQANGDVETALRELRAYIHGHMNTSLAGSTSAYPPIQLKYRYERLVQAELERVTGGSNNDLYNQAQQHCEQSQPQSFLGAGRLGCIQQYIDSHGGQQQEAPRPIPDSLYKFDFASPVWSPDLAGWSLVLSALFLLLFSIRFGLELWFRNQFKHHA